jgi:hypothetical protein
MINQIAKFQAFWWTLVPFLNQIHFYQTECDRMRPFLIYVSCPATLKVRSIQKVSKTYSKLCWYLKFCLSFTLLFSGAADLVKKRQLLQGLDFYKYRSYNIQNRSLPIDLLICPSLFYNNKMRKKVLFFKIINSILSACIIIILYAYYSLRFDNSI